MSDTVYTLFPGPFEPLNIVRICKISLLKVLLRNPLYLSGLTVREGFALGTVYTALLGPCRPAWSICRDVFRSRAAGQGMSGREHLGQARMMELGSCLIASRWKQRKESALVGGFLCAARTRTTSCPGYREVCALPGGAGAAYASKVCSRWGPTETMRSFAPVRSARAARYFCVAFGSFL